MAQTFVPPYHVPVTDPRTGIATTAWQQYFRDLGELAKLSTVTTSFITDGAVTEVKQTLADVTTWDVSSTRHGYAPKSPADATKFLNGAATPVYALVKDSDLSTTDITTNNVTSTKHGFTPKSPADVTKFLNGAATPAFALVKDSDLSTIDITTNNVTTAKHGFAPKAPNDATKYLDGTGAYSVPPGTGSYTSENARDDIGAALVAGSGVTITVNDGADTITIAATGLSAGTPPTIVQYTSSLTLKSAVFGVAPTSGNLLVAICKGANVTVGAGWTRQDFTTAGTNFSLIATKVAGGGESTTQTPLSTDANEDAVCIWELNGQAASSPVVFSNATFLPGQSFFTTGGPIGSTGDGENTALPGMANVLALAAIFTDTTTPQTITAAMNMTQSELSNSGTYTHFVSGHSDGSTPVAQLISRCTSTIIATRPGIIHITA